jgi:AraC family transcriptional regulator
MIDQNRDVHVPLNTSGGLLAWQTKRVLNYIDAHIGEPIPVSDLAIEANLSTSHFFRSFRTSMGISPADFIMRRRVEAAQELMRTTDRPLSRVAFECGLSDQPHLCRLFRRFHGLTPKQWKTAHAREPREARISFTYPSKEEQS